MGEIDFLWWSQGNPRTIMHYLQILTAYASEYNIEVIDVNILNKVMPKDFT